MGYKHDCRSREVIRLFSLPQTKAFAMMKTRWKDWLGNGNTGVQKALKPRHVIFLALGGTIGTGVFFSMGATVAAAGPGGALLIYGITAIFVVAVVVCLCEMVAYIPDSGAFQHYGSRFIDESFGFALGINYYLQWAFSIPSEISAGTFVIQYWAPDVPAWVWCFVITFPVFAVQLFNVKVYGEVEYWAALVKVILVVVFIIVGLLYDWGAVKTAKVPSPGLDNFRHGLAFLHGFSGVFRGGYAFYSYGGTELVALTSGETERPWKTIPRAAKGTFVRVILFMMMMILVIGLCINANDPRLVTADEDSDISVSPITLVFEFAGFGAARHVVNAVLLTSILSSINSCFYAASRMLMALARRKQFFPIFAWTTPSGVPLAAELLTLGISCLVFLTTIWGNGVVFTWFQNLTSASAIITWMSIGPISYRFRKALKTQGVPESDLPFKQFLFPLLPILIVIIGGFLFVGLGYASATYPGWTWRDPFGTYLGVVVFTLSYAGWKIYHWKTDKFQNYKTMDVTTGASWPVGQGPYIMEAAREEDFRELYKSRRTLLGRAEYVLYRVGEPLTSRRIKRKLADANLVDDASHTGDDKCGVIERVAEVE